MTSLTVHTVNLFKVVVADKTVLMLDHARDGFITDFVPTLDELTTLKDIFKALPVVTLFSVREREALTLEALLTKQILHYIEVYGLGAPGLFGLEMEGGTVHTLAYIKAVTLVELHGLVRDLLYANRPVADVVPIIELVRGYDVPYDINQVKNNELKVALFDPKKDNFVSGDDAVRYICYIATGAPLLIKSKTVIEAVTKKPVGDGFLSTHEVPLARVFNRHKRLILACKSPLTRHTINRISRYSKTLHVPMIEPVARRLVAGIVSGAIKVGALADVPLRDKLKYLNLIEWKLQGHTYDTFLIRNGKVWFENERKVMNPTALHHLREAVVESLKDDLSLLSDTSILLDPNVDYGLPISRKQALGNLPFGTRITAVAPERFSAGVYWHNDFGDGSSIDLDLSAINEAGDRTGWGGYAAYAANQPIVFSGDVTDARHGAIEFMTVNPNRRNRYGLMVNIFRGPEPCGAEIVVGHGTKDNWQTHTLIREKISLASKQMLIGFLKDNTFVVYSGRLSNARVSGGKHPVIDKGLGTLWTVKDLFKAAGVRFDTVPKPGVTYTHDLRYEGFSMNKLEALLTV